MNRSASALRSEVLIVDRSPESREVFRTVLERRGLVTLEASTLHDGLELARRYRPRVVVLDLDDEAAGDEEIAFAEYREQCRQYESALLVLGVVRDGQQSCGEQMVTKPYHYAPLIRKIEQLCRQSLEADRRVSSVAG